jgi:hypothetical protein
MHDLRDHIRELAEAGASEARVPGAQHAILRGRRRRLGQVGGAAVMVLALVAGGVAVQRLTGESDTTLMAPGKRPQPPATILERPNLEQFALNAHGPIVSAEKSQLAERHAASPTALSGDDRGRSTCCMFA